MDLDDYKIRGVSLIATAIQHMSGTGNVFYRHTVEQRRNMMKVFVDLFAFVENILKKMLGNIKQMLKIFSCLIEK